MELRSHLEPVNYLEVTPTVTETSKNPREYLDEILTYFFKEKELGSFFKAVNIPNQLTRNKLQREKPDGNFKKLVNRALISLFDQKLVNAKEVQYLRSQFLVISEFITIAGKILPEGTELVPHMRTRDYNIPEGVYAAINNVMHISDRIKKVLLVTGDAFGDPRPIEKVLKTSDILGDIGKNKKLITKIPKKEIITEENFAVAADIYDENWKNMPDKLAFLKQFPDTQIFTQPIFTDTALIKVIDYFREHDIPLSSLVAGYTWVENMGSKNYWENVNKIPKGEIRTGEDGIAQAADMLRIFQQLKLSTYLMYLESLNRENVEKIIKKSQNISEF